MILYTQNICGNNHKFSISKKIPSNMTGDDITILATAKIKTVNVFEESTECSSEELVLFITLTSFITQRTTVNVQFVFLCKNWNNSPHPYNLLNPQLCMQLPCCFMTGDVHVVCSTMVQHYLRFIRATHLLATHSIMAHVGTDGEWDVKSKEFWYTLDIGVNKIKKVWGVLQSEFHIFIFSLITVWMKLLGPQIKSRNLILFFVHSK